MHDCGEYSDLAQWFSCKGSFILRVRWEKFRFIRIVVEEMTLAIVAFSDRRLVAQREKLSQHTESYYV